MEHLFNTTEVLKTLSLFFGFLLFFSLGLLFHFRNQFESLKSRWLHNLSLSTLNTLSIRLIIPYTLIEIAQNSFESNVGILNFLKPPMALKFILSLVLMDLIIYFQHRITHHFNILWHLHRVHHSDIGFDSTTAVRFHPFEILFSFFIKGLSIIAFGISAQAIITFEILLALSSLFNHSNFSINAPFEKWIRFFIVTPDMHRVHHSTLNDEMNTNYGFCLSLWDKLFKTYQNKSSQDPKNMRIGLSQFRELEEQKIIPLLIQPFKK